MPDLFLSEKPKTVIKRRAPRIQIENPKAGGKSVSYVYEDTPVYEDGTYAAPDKTDFLGSLDVPFSDLAVTVYAITCPGTGQTLQLSGAAIALWLEEDFVTRMMAELDAKNISEIEE